MPPTLDPVPMVPRGKMRGALSKLLIQIGVSLSLYVPNGVRNSPPTTVRCGVAR